MYHVIINPAGGAGATKKTWQKAEKFFRDANAEYTVHYSSREHDMDEICKELTSDDKEVSIVIVGGDGSVNKAVNGIVNFEKVKFGIIPCGSANDLAKALGLSKNPEKTVKMILKNTVTRVMDVGEVTFNHSSDHLQKTITEPFTRRFMISSGIGFDAEICEKVEASHVKHFLNKIGLGKLVYIYIAIGVIFTTKKIGTVITNDGKKKEYPKSLFTVCMNTMYEGGGFKFCPKADPYDHALDICTGGDLSMFDFFRIFPYAYTGGHVKFNEVFSDRTSETRITAEEPLWVHTDGEVECKSKDITFRLSAHRLNLLV